MDRRAELSLDTQWVRSRLCRFIGRGIAGAGRHRAVLGLSGGLDSAVVCYLAAEALGSENVLALTMPYSTSSPSSLADALDVVRSTGVEHLHFEISPMLRPLFAAFTDMDARRRGNAMARARMIVLYDRSEAFGGLVLGTGNKTEILLGYSTLHGDSACALAPIGNLYKTQVRQLAAHLGVPDSIRLKPPSADLWPGQTDEEELGLSYEAADSILWQLFERGRHPRDLLADGYPAEQVSLVCRSVRRSQFKRCLPPVGPTGQCRDATPAGRGSEATLWPDLDST